MKMSRRIWAGWTIGALLIVSIPVASYAATGESLFKSPIDILVGSKDNYDRLPQEKKEEIDKETKQLEQARAGIIKQAPKTEALAQRVADTPAPFDSGIMDKEAPPGVSDIAVSNIWRGIIDNQKISLYAGAKADDSEQGLIFLDIMNEGNETTSFKELNTPAKAGPVKVVKENAGVITLESDSGTVFTFDVRSLEFQN